MYIKYQWDAEYCNRVLERRAAAAAASLQGWKKVVTWKILLSLFDTALRDLKLIKIIFVSYISGWCSRDCRKELGNYFDFV